MLTDQSNQDKKPLSSNKNLTNSARTPIKQSSSNELSTKEKENLKQESVVLKKEDLEEKIKKYEEEIAKNKERIKEKSIKENKLLDEINQMRLKMIPLLDKITFLENNQSELKKDPSMESRMEAMKEENSDLQRKNEELQKELGKRDEIFKEWNEVVDQLDSKLNKMEQENSEIKHDNDALKSDNQALRSDNQALRGENQAIKSENQAVQDRDKTLSEKLEFFEKELEGLRKENVELVTEKQEYRLEIERLRCLNSEMEASHLAEKQEKEMVILDQKQKIFTLKESLKTQSEESKLKIEALLQENGSNKEKLEIVSKKNSFLTSRIYELNKEKEELKAERSFLQCAKNSENVMIRPVHTRKSFELLNDTLTLKLNNLEKIFHEEETNRRLSKDRESITQETKERVNKNQNTQGGGTDKNRGKGHFRSVSAHRGGVSREDENEKRAENEERAGKKKQKNEFESDFVKKFKKVISHLEARLENLASEETNK